MDTPDNYYAILGVPIDADIDTLKRAYRHLARRYHPDLAGPGGAVQMKRINRAYAVLSDPEKRRSYDTIVGGVIDFRKGGAARMRPTRPDPQIFDPDSDFSDLNTFSTKGPLRKGTTIHSQLGVVSALNSVPTVHGLLIAAGSLDGKGMLWHIHDEQVGTPIAFAANPAFTIESLRELRLSSAGALLAGWGLLGLHVWDAVNGNLLWSYQLRQRAVSAHYSLDVVLQAAQKGQRAASMALPLLPEDTRAPRSRGVRGTDIVSHLMDTPATSLSEPIVCPEEGIENRHFWAIRLRALAQDAQTLVTLSCGNVPQEQQEMAIIRRWDLTTRSRMGRVKPQVAASVVVGQCADCAPPYAVTPDTKTVAFVHTGKKIRVCDTIAGTYSELLSAKMGGSAKMALSPDAQWVAIAREDSEVNEGVIDLWSVSTGQVAQKLYHPWQISALHFAGKHLVVALTDGTIQMWK